MCLSMGDISADAACGITRCAGSRLQDRAGLRASIRVRPNAGHSIQFCYRRRAWQLCRLTMGNVIWSRIFVECLTTINTG